MQVLYWVLERSFWRFLTCVLSQCNWITLVITLCYSCQWNRICKFYVSCLWFHIFLLCLMGICWQLSFLIRLKKVCNWKAGDLICMHMYLYIFFLGQKTICWSGHVGFFLSRILLFIFWSSFAFAFTIGAPLDIILNKGTGLDCVRG